MRTVLMNGWLERWHNTTNLFYVFCYCVLVYIQYIFLLKKKEGLKNKEKVMGPISVKNAININKSTVDFLYTILYYSVACAHK